MHESCDTLYAEFCKKNYIPIPVGDPFATVVVHNKLVNVTMVPRAQICGAEIENFAESPILFDICLTLRAGTNRVAV